jgi:hypothetical protein
VNELPVKTYRKTGKPLNILTFSVLGVSILGVLTFAAPALGQGSDEVSFDSYPDKAMPRQNSNSDYGQVSVNEQMADSDPNRDPSSDMPVEVVPYDNSQAFGPSADQAPVQPSDQAPVPPGL